MADKKATPLDLDAIQARLTRCGTVNLSEAYALIAELRALRAEVARLREVNRLLAEGPLTEEQAEAEFDAAPEVPLSPERIDEIVKYATKPTPTPEEKHE
jgi:hypothetical protein